MQGVGETIMPALETLQVFQALNRSPNARLVHSAELGDGLSAALWTNHHDAQEYEAPSHHTLSCYIDGGTGTFRRGQPGNKGGPDKLCILPAEHQSAWIINGEIQLAHLYIEQEQFALGAVALLDREPRSLQLEEATFLEDAEQSARFRQLCTLDWQEPGERLLASSLAHELLDHALLTQVGLRQGLRLKGGLAPALRKRLRDFIEQHLAEPLPLGQLAGWLQAHAGSYKRVTTLEQDLARGYSLVEEDVTRTRWVRCGGAKGERPRLCLDEYDVTVTRRVPVDAEVARAELGVLKARLVKQRAPMDAAVAQCRIQFPEEKEG